MEQAVVKTKPVSFLQCLGEIEAKWKTLSIEPKLYVPGEFPMKVYSFTSATETNLFIDSILEKQGPGLIPVGVDTETDTRRQYNKGFPSTIQIGFGGSIVGIFQVFVMKQQEQPFPDSLRKLLTSTNILKVRELE
jgi:hypothetical protein